MFRRFKSAPRPKPEPPSRPVQIVLALAASFAMITIVPVITDRMGVMFLPDPNLIADWHVTLVGVAVGLALVVLTALMLTPPRGITFQILRIVAPAIYMGVFYVGLTTSVPLVWTTFTGKPVVKVVTVETPAGLASSRCFPAIQLQSMPMIFNRLCNVPPKMAVKLMPGDKLLLIGHGSGLGLFYQEARLLDGGTDL